MSFSRQAVILREFFMNKALKLIIGKLENSELGFDALRRGKVQKKALTRTTATFKGKALCKLLTTIHQTRQRLKIR